MRTLIIAAALFCAPSTSAFAQQGEAARPDRVAPVEAPLAAASLPLQNVCIATEYLSAPRSTFPPVANFHYYHSFYTTDGSGALYRIDVTPAGLRVNSSTQVAPLEGSPEADTRFNSLIETLRAAAASRSAFRIDRRNASVTLVTVFWTQRCGG